MADTSPTVSCDGRDHSNTMQSSEYRMKECLNSSSTGQPRRDMLNAHTHTHKHKDEDLSLPRQARDSDRERRGKRKAEGKRERATW